MVRPTDYHPAGRWFNTWARHAKIEKGTIISKHPGGRDRLGPEPMISFVPPKGGEGGDEEDRMGTPRVCGGRWGAHRWV